jgi:hypothetical protein
MAISSLLSFLFPHNAKDQRREPAADDVSFDYERFGWLPFAAVPVDRSVTQHTPFDESHLPPLQRFDKRKSFTFSTSYPSW